MTPPDALPIYDFSQMSDEELERIAAGGAVTPQYDFSRLSDAELEAIAYGTPSATSNQRAQAVGQGLLFNMFDELEAGAKTAEQALGQGVADYVVNPVRGALGYEPLVTNQAKGYEENLSDVRSSEAEYLKNHPYEALALQMTGGIAGAFVPGLNLGMGIKGATAGKRIWDATKAGAAYGALSGFGSGEGFADRVGDAIKGGAIGGGAGGALGALAEGVSAVAIPAERQGQQQAGRVLEEALTPEERLRAISTPTDELGALRPLAEASQSPKVANITQALLDTTDDAKKALQVNLQKRNNTILRSLEGISDEPQRALASAGDEIREAVSPIQQKAIKDIERQAVSAESKSTVPMDDFLKQADDIVWRNYRSGDIPSEISSIIKDAKRGLEPSELRRYGYPTQKANDLAPFTVSEKPYHFLDDIRKRLFQAQDKAGQLNDGRTLKAVTELKYLVDDTIKQAGDLGMMTSDEVSRHINSDKLWSEYFKTYGADKAFGAITNRYGPEGDFKLLAENVMGRIWMGRRSDGQAILKAVGENPEALSKIQGGIRDELLRAAYPPGSESIRPEAALKLIEQWRPGLTAKKGSQSLFDEKHIDAIERVFTELKYLGTTRPESLKGLSSVASRGQPTTAERLIRAKPSELVKQITNSLPLAASYLGYNAGGLPGIFAGWAIGSTVGKRAGQIQTAFKEAMIRALLEDRNFAFQLLQKADDTKITEAISRVIVGAARGQGDAFSNLLFPTGDASKERGRESQRQLGPQSTNSTRPFSDSDEVEVQGIPQQTQPTKTPKKKQLTNQGGESGLSPDQLVRSQAFEKSPTSFNPEPTSDLSQDPFTNIAEIIQKQPPLIQAVIEVESAKDENGIPDPRSVSPAGAKGLMQLMPANVKAFNVSDPFDPLANIAGGTALLEEEMRRFKDPLLALASYNVGSPRVNAAIKKAGSRDWDRVKAHLPRETREYVPKVLSAYERIAEALV